MHMLCNSLNLNCPRSFFYYSTEEGMGAQLPKATENDDKFEWVLINGDGTLRIWTALSSGYVGIICIRRERMERRILQRKTGYK